MASYRPTRRPLRRSARPGGPGSAPASNWRPVRCSPSLIGRIWRLGRQAVNRLPLMGFRPLQHMRLALRCGRSHPPHDPASAFCAVSRSSPMRFYASRQSGAISSGSRPCESVARVCPEQQWLSRHHIRACAFLAAVSPVGLGRTGASCRCLARSFIAGFFACDVSYRCRRPRAALPAAFHSRRRSWGFSPFAASLRPGQQSVSTSHAPHAVCHDSASINFRRGIGRVF